jgi:hypothetical protein
MTNLPTQLMTRGSGNFRNRGAASSVRPVCRYRERAAEAKAAGASQLVLYVEFRKDGVPVDPGPWWAVNEGQKVRG